MIDEGFIGSRGPLVQVVLRAPDGGQLEGVGLLDSGGQFTMLDSNAARSLGLRVQGERLTKTACGSCTMQSVSASLLVGSRKTWFEKTFECTPLPAGNPPLLAVLGLDYMLQGRFSMDGSRRLWRFVTDD